jgi:hypothetical protein
VPKTNGTSMSIPHFSSLSAKRKQFVFDHFDEFQVQEKIDGSYLKFKNDTGFYWATRKGSNSPIYKSPDEWGADFWVTGFRAAHTALIQSLPAFHDNYFNWGPLYPSGVLLELEVVFADTPNTIFYSDKNHLIIHTPVGQFAYALTQTVTLSDVPVTDDGYTIKRISKTYDFEITNLAYHDNITMLGSGLIKRGFINNVDELEQGLLHHVQTSLSVLSGAGAARMEGLVFKHQDGWMFKIVDKQWFTEANKQNYAFRNTLFKSPRGFRNSLMDRFYDMLAKGTDAKIAASEALKQLDVEHQLYMKWDHSRLEAFVHKRNLEALASIRAQLNNIAVNGLPNESN